MEAYKRGSHTVLGLQEYHVVWVAKYRYPVLGGDVGLRCRELLREAARAYEIARANADNDGQGYACARRKGHRAPGGGAQSKASEAPRLFVGRATIASSIKKKLRDVRSCVAKTTQPAEGFARPSRVKKRAKSYLEDVTFFTANQIRQQLTEGSAELSRPAPKIVLLDESREVPEYEEKKVLETALNLQPGKVSPLDVG